MSQNDFFPQIYLVINERFFENIPKELWPQIFDIESITCIRLAKAEYIQTDTLKEIAWKNNVAIIQTVLVNSETSLFHILDDIDGLHVSGDFQNQTLSNFREKHTDIAIGTESNASLHHAMIAGEKNADYICFNDLFAVDNMNIPANEDVFHAANAWASSMEIPCVVSGGIRENNFQTALSTHAEFIEISPSIWNEGESALTILKNLHDTCLENPLTNE